MDPMILSTRDVAWLSPGLSKYIIDTSVSVDRPGMFLATMLLIILAVHKKKGTAGEKLDKIFYRLNRELHKNKRIVNDLKCKMQKRGSRGRTPSKTPNARRSRKNVRAGH